MARYTGPKTRISRRFGMPIYGHSKSLERRNYAPGMHGPKSRRKLTDYALRLAEKQKFRYYYGLLEKQFRAVYEKARRARGVTGERMLQILETRLDNIVYRLGFAPTRPAARQMVSHGHLKINGKRVNIPSFSVEINDSIEVRDATASKQLATKHLENASNRVIPDWLNRDTELLKGVLTRIPSREEIAPIGNEQVVVEFYSR